MKKKFALIGVAGYVAKKHLEAINSINGELIACCDLNDSVGIIDSFFPKTKYFNSIKKFEKYLISYRKKIGKIDYFVICTPNHLHNEHIELGLRNKINVICEKPIITNTSQIKNILELEKKFNKNVYCILQLRQHENVNLIRNYIKNTNFITCSLEYITPRGDWYDLSWKGNEKLSGGILFNIGVHLFDFLIYVFGDYNKFIVKKINNRNVNGKIFFSNAEVKWKLSLDPKTKSNMIGKREIIINNKKYDLNEGFHSSHSNCYEAILKNNKIFLAKNSFKSIYFINKMKKEISKSNKA